jgi:hypothetical protein
MKLTAQIYYRVKLRENGTAGNPGPAHGTFCYNLILS